MRSVGRYVPALALMGLIFFLSAQPDLPEVDADWNLVLRKAAHMTEYGLLWTLWLWGLRRPRPAAARLALAIALAYAASDEIHQAFVPNRHSSPFDIAIDSAGMGLAALVWVLRTRRRGATGASRGPDPGTWATWE